jgi:hypothetical protein
VLRSNVADPNQIGRLMRIGGIGMKRKMTGTSERWRKKERKISKKLIGVSTEKLYPYVFYCLYMLLHG